MSYLEIEESNSEYIRYAKQIVESVIYKKKPNESHYRSVVDEKSPVIIKMLKLKRFTIF